MLCANFFLFFLFNGFNEWILNHIIYNITVWKININGSWIILIIKENKFNFDSLIIYIYDFTNRYMIHIFVYLYGINLLKGLVHRLFCILYYLLLQTAVVQYGPSSLSVEMFATGQHHDLKTEIQVKGIYTTKVIEMLYQL